MILAQGMLTLVCIDLVPKHVMNLKYRKTLKDTSLLPIYRVLLYNT